MTHWHRLDLPAVLAALETDVSSGLSAEAVEQRRSQFGINTLADYTTKSPGRMLWEQVTASPIVVLLLAVLASVWLQDYKDAIAILAIVVLTVLLGWSQEYQAERALVALKQLAVPTVTVWRDSQWAVVSARDLVPGDRIRLEAGNLVPADGRVLVSANLQVQESALTGEATAIAKTVAWDEASTTESAFYPTMVYMGTTVTAGRGEAVITATGMQTELGTVAQLMQTVGHQATPLQQRLDRLSQKLVAAILVLVAVIFGLGVWRGEPLQLMFLTAVSIAVGVLPEGLPAIVTIALALGSQRMLRQQALIRQLPAVETLGSVTVICADKTGTLTENRMTVTAWETAREEAGFKPPFPYLGEGDLEDVACFSEGVGKACGISVSRGVGHDKPGEEGNCADPAKTVQDGSPPSPGGGRGGQTCNAIDQSPGLALLLLASVLCNDASSTLGDPTEVALVVSANLFGVDKAQVDTTYPRIAELPFDRDRNRMTTLHSGFSEFPAFQSIPELSTEPYLAVSKGAIANLLDICTQIWVKDGVEPLDAEWRDHVLLASQTLAAQGARVLAVGMRGGATIADPDWAAVEQQFILLGWVAMADLARPQVKQAVQDCKTAGIRPVMITGDHPLTALYLAQELGLVEQPQVLTGADLAQLSLAELATQVEQVSVYARVSPEQKLTIVQAFQQCHHVVAMTGDGINDAPALRKADIGVAMGQSGTDVAKEAADMVLLDDNFATIVAAVKEGRVIYDNIRKAIKYLLSGNSGEIWVMALAPLLGMPLPLLPLQILWINLMSDGLPALALTLEPPEDDTMHRPPHAPDEQIFSRGMGWDIIWIGFLTGGVSLGTGYAYWHVAPNAHWQTMLFTILTFAETVIALAVRSEHRSLFEIGLGSNPALFGAIALTLLLHLAILYLPLGQSLFQTAPLSPSELGVAVGMSLLVFAAIEGQKFWQRHTSTPPPN